MRVTVCELPHDPSPRDEAWARLVDHCREDGSDLVVLPEMPFSVWLAATKEVEPERWDEAVATHDTWLERLGELGAPIVIGARPVVVDGSRRNEGFVWEDGTYTATHHKYYLPDEDGYWEATWYDRGPAPEYPAVELEAVTAGVLLCTEVWFTEHARTLARGGVDILATPRATEWDTRERWLTGGRVAAMMSGAFGLSSNHSGTDAIGMRWGGYGWIVDPNGTVLATTSEDEPFATVAIDLLDAAKAKATYPRYVAE